MSFDEALDVCDARSSFSQSSTLSPRPAASRAMPQPLMPPPMMTRSYKLEGMPSVRKPYSRRSRGVTKTSRGNASRVLRFDTERTRRGSRRTAPRGLASGALPQLVDRLDLRRRFRKLRLCFRDLERARLVADGLFRRLVRFAGARLV